MSWYLLPEAVVTVAPTSTFPRTGDVVIRSPLRKFFELLTLPEILPSLFLDQFFKTGMPGLGLIGAAFLAGALFVAACFCTLCAGLPNRAKVPEVFFFTTLVAAGLCFFAAAFKLIVPPMERLAGFFAEAILIVAAGVFAFEVPKNEVVFFGAGFRAGVGSTLGAGLGALPKSENGFGAGLGAGVGSTFGAGLGAGEPPKNENGFGDGVGAGTGSGSTLGAGLGALPKSENGFAAGFGAGVGSTFGAGLGAAGLLPNIANGLAAGLGVGAGATFGAGFGAAGLLAKNEKVLAGFAAALGAGAGAGVGATFLGAGDGDLEDPKKDANASVTGSSVLTASFFGATGAFFTGAGAFFATTGAFFTGAVAFFAGAAGFFSKNPPKNGLLSLAATGAGATFFGAGGGTTFFGAGAAFLAGEEKKFPMIPADFFSSEFQKFLKEELAG